MNTKKQIPALFLLITGNLLFFFTVWLCWKYDKVSVEQLLFQMKSCSDGVDGRLTSSAVFRVGGFGIAMTAAEVLLYQWLSRRNRARFLIAHATAFALLIVAGSILFFAERLQVAAYVDAVSTESDFIEQHYVSPDTVQIQFPEKKRNLIYIYLESMENTFGDVDAKGPISDCFIPELKALAGYNINFSNNSQLGGAYSYSGTTWTAAAMASQTCGVPVKVPMDADGEAFGKEEDFLPGVVSLGEILAKEGYSQTLLVGSNAAFHGREAYFTQHGDYRIVDIESLKEEKRLPEDYHEWWGFEDRRLFAFAKVELKRIAQEGEPFNFTMLTADTHFPDGYVCGLCPDTYEEQYANVLTCSSAQVYEFITWLRRQPFYENTTIVISGDHLTMDSDFLDDIDPDYVRTVYNCIINSAVRPVKEKNREFATFDMYPTTLAAMGVTVQGDRLGLGTNLFSDKKTLTERYGFEALEEELQKNSEFYDRMFLQIESWTGN